MGGWPRGRVALTFLAVLSAVSIASAHSRHLSRSQWTFDVEGGTAVGVLGIDSKDLDEAFGLIDDTLPADRAARSEAVKQRIYDGMATHVLVENGGTRCAFKPLWVRQKNGFDIAGHYTCAAPLTTVVVTHAWLATMAHAHRHFARLADRPEKQDLRQLTRTRTSFERTFEADSPDGASEGPTRSDRAIPLRGTAAFSAFFVDGLIHFGTGWDHILFLLALILVARSLRQVVLTVTAFSVAHSITLALAYLEWVSLPGLWVEVAIAASIVWVAIENIVRPELAGRWAPAFVFGLIHGFGFAGFLSDLAIADSNLLVALLGFNLGVEAGQLAVVILLVPFILKVSESPRYRSRVLVPASLAIVALGGMWVLERVLA